MFLESLDGEEIFVIHELLSRMECERLIARSESLELPGVRRCLLFLGRIGA